MILTFAYRRGSVADPRGGRPPRPKCSQFHAVFTENLANLYVGVPSWRVGAPSYEESWIRPWGSLPFDTPLLLFLFEFIYSAFNFIAGHLRCYVCKNCKGDLGSQQGQCLKCATVFQQGKLSFELIEIESYRHKISKFFSQYKN